MQSSRDASAPSPTREAVVFANAAFRLLFYALAGRLDPVVAVPAAQTLFGRALIFLLVVR
jgi:hypothetical protein